MSSVLRVDFVFLRSGIANIPQWGVVGIFDLLSSVYHVFHPSMSYRCQCHNASMSNVELNGKDRSMANNIDLNGKCRSRCRISILMANRKCRRSKNIYRRVGFFFQDSEGWGGVRKRAAETQGKCPVTSVPGSTQRCVLPSSSH